MEKKTVPSKNFMIFSATTTLHTMNEMVEKEVNKLYAKAGELQLQPTGPLEFIYTGATKDMDKEFLLEIAMPIEEVPALLAEGYQFKKSEPFPCISVTHHGAISELASVYDKIFTDLWNNSVKTGDQIREVYATWYGMDSTQNITEIQIGIHE
ncbi:MAG: GyrI-like domain-containing protein [Cytophagaceae bacterium]|nr:GyrI-like domain-containing protein [Cytophagaceae bacterium]